MSDITNKIQHLKLDDICVSPFESQTRRREHFRHEDDLEMAASIESFGGLIQPIVVRPIHDGTAYEIVCGERRYRGMKSTSFKTIAATVRKLTDDEAIEIQLQENLQRVNPSPLDEAFAFSYMLRHDPKLTVTELAARFGRSEALIRRRMKLNELIPDAVTDVRSGKLPLAHAEALALLPLDLQTQILKSCYLWDGHAQSINNFRALIKQTSLVLSEACFPLDDAGLSTDRPACIDCKERTGYEPTLFGPADLGEEDRCLVASCFESKRIAWIRRNKLELQAEIGGEEKDVPMLQTGWQDPPKAIGPARIVKSRSVTHSETSECENAFRTIVADGACAGSTRFVCETDGCSVHDAETESDRAPDRYVLEHQEAIFNRQVEDNVSFRVRQAVWDQQKESGWMGIDPELGAKLLVKVFPGRWERLERKMISDMVGHDVTEADDYRVSELATNVWSMLEISRILYVIAHPLASNQETVCEIAKGLKDFSYAKYDADARVELAPEEFRTILEEYRDAVYAGEAPLIPRLWTQGMKDVVVVCPECSETVSVFLENDTEAEIDERCECEGVSDESLIALARTATA